MFKTKAITMESFDAEMFEECDVWRINSSFMKGLCGFKFGFDSV